MKKTLIALLLLILILSCGQGNNRKKGTGANKVSADAVAVSEAKEPVPDSLSKPLTRKDLFYKEAEYGDNAWNDTVRVFHYWRNPNEFDYYFDKPPEQKVAEWKALCEEMNVPDEPGVPPYYLNMNQFVTIGDFVQLWYGTDSPILDEDFVLWRLAEYEEQCSLLDSEYDRFYHLKSAIQGLCLFDAQFQYEINLLAGLKADFQTFYTRLMVREAIQHASPRIGAALQEEEKAWESYHEAVEMAYIVLEGSPSGMTGSSWPMAVSEIKEDDAHMRETSLADYLFALTDSLDYRERHPQSCIDDYEIKRHSAVTDKTVLAEYRRFIDSVVSEDEFEYPIATRRKALSDEKAAWEKWMQKRRVVSSLLTGLCKDTYDNATNNVRRHKLIMLKNQYSGYGITSQDVLDCLLPYEATDEQLNGPSFDERWKAYL